MNFAHTRKSTTPGWHGPLHHGKMNIAGLFYLFKSDKCSAVLQVRDALENGLLVFFISLLFFLGLKNKMHLYRRWRSEIMVYVVCKV